MIEAGHPSDESRREEPRGDGEGIIHVLMKAPKTNWKQVNGKSPGAASIRRRGMP